MESHGNIGNFTWENLSSTVVLENSDVLFKQGRMRDYYLDKIAEYVHLRSRLAFTGHRRCSMRHRLECRLDELALPDFSAYWNHLLGNKEEEGRLLELLTTNETSFFRNPAQFSYLKERIIPRYELMPSLNRSRIRILCAGCSTGEEPYSIAMTILNAIRYPESREVEIVAGDLSMNCLREAEAGFYDVERLKNLPQGFLDRYFDKRGDGAVVREKVKQLVRFIYLNLNDLMKNDSAGAMDQLGRFDIIFCRNVMIYFSPPCQQKLVETLHEMLLNGGYLFTGDAEPLHLFRHEFRAVDEADCLIYQKTEKVLNAEDAR